MGVSVRYLGDGRPGEAGVRFIPLEDGVDEIALLIVVTARADRCEAVVEWYCLIMSRRVWDRSGGRTPLFRGTGRRWPS